MSYYTFHRGGRSVACGTVTVSGSSQSSCFALVIIVELLVGESLMMAALRYRQLGRNGLSSPVTPARPVPPISFPSHKSLIFLSDLYKLLLFLSLALFSFPERLLPHF